MQIGSTTGNIPSYLQQSKEGGTALEQSISQNLKEKLQARISLGHEDVSCHKPFAKRTVENGSVKQTTKRKLDLDRTSIHTTIQYISG